MSESRKGRDRLINSVAWNWVSHLIFVVAGFVLPRAIDVQLGQELLGIWDFAWSVVGYMALMQLGLGSSVNRYVAKYKAERDPEGMCRSVSSVLAIQVVLGLVIVLVSLVVAYGLLPNTERVPAVFLGNVQILVITLGASQGVRTAFGAYDGVITGLHRWDVYNLINTGFHAATIAMMVAALIFGADLSALGLVYLAGSIALVVVRTAAAHKLCPELRISLRNVTSESMLEMAKFSGKSFVGGMARTLLYQSNSIVVGLAMGPAALAVYSRPLSLVSQSTTFVTKLANPLTPIIGAAQAESNEHEVSSITLAAARISATLSLSGMLILAWVGGVIIQIWMGEGYRNDWLIAILAVGHVFTIGHLPVSTTLVGLNAHGVPALISVIAAVLATSIAIFGLHAGWISFISAAAVLATTKFVSDGIFVPIYACRKLGLSILDFYYKIWLRAVLVALPILLGWSMTVLQVVPDAPLWLIFVVALSASCAIFLRKFQVLSRLAAYKQSRSSSSVSE